MFQKYLLIASLLFVSLVRADTQDIHDLDNSQDSEGRFLFSNNGNLMLQTNATAILAVIAVLFILGLLVAGAFFLFDDTNRNDQYQYDNQAFGSYQYDPNSYEQDHYYRKRRHATFDNDLAFQMDKLNSAFKAYEVENDDCKRYVACEASQIERLEDNGELAKEVLNIMSNLKRHGKIAVSSKRPFVGDLLDTFVAGQLARENQMKDACGKLRNACTSIKKPY